LPNSGGLSRRLAMAAIAGGAITLNGAPILAAEPKSQVPQTSVNRDLAAHKERWRAVKEGRLKLPLPGTPDTSQPMTRLAEAGLSIGAPVVIRVFKAESELEVWLEKKHRFVRFATYPICYWSGSLGPKLREGDKQTPEGFYYLTENSLHHGGRWRRSLNIGFPNAYDRMQGRSGSVILIHGGCDSIGCLAMTNEVNAEIYDLVAAALSRGAASVPVHVFPFRMTAENIAAQPIGRWSSFWDDLRRGYESFERTRLPPRISVCQKRYRIDDASSFVRTPDRLEHCPQDTDQVPDPFEVHQLIEHNGTPRREAAVKAPPAPRCDVSRPSCRKWVALRDRRHTSRLISDHGAGGKRSKIR
jgi:murein L,D-transpeptidase YafK